MPHYRGYLLEKGIGEGGQAGVYKAEDLTIRDRLPYASKAETKKAVKVYHSLNQDLAEQAEKEASLGASLQHPGILHVESYGNAQLSKIGRQTTERFITVSDFLPDGSLDKFFKKVQNPRLLIGQRSLFVFNAAEAAGFLHDNNYGHLDLKPHNALAKRQGNNDLYSAVLIDLGLATPINEYQNGSGTTAYMAPEHFGGGPVTPELDIYAMGVLATWLFTEQYPIRARGGDYKTAHKFNKPDSLLEILGRDSATPIHRAVGSIILKCLEKEPENRYPSMQAFAADFWNAYLEGLEAEHAARGESLSLPTELATPLDGTKNFSTLLLTLEKTLRKTKEYTNSSTGRGPQAPPSPKATPKSPPLRDLFVAGQQFAASSPHQPSQPGNVGNNQAAAGSQPSAPPPQPAPGLPPFIQEVIERNQRQIAERDRDPVSSVPPRPPQGNPDPNPHHSTSPTPPIFAVPPSSSNGEQSNSSSPPPQREAARAQDRRSRESFGRSLRREIGEKGTRLLSAAALLAPIALGASIVGTKEIGDYRTYKEMFADNWALGDYAYKKFWSHGKGFIRLDHGGMVYFSDDYQVSSYPAAHNSFKVYTPGIKVADPGYGEDPEGHHVRINRFDDGDGKISWKEMVGIRTALKEAGVPVPQNVDLRDRRAVYKYYEKNA